MKDWYYAQDEQQHGPVNKTKLLDLIKSGDMDRDDLVWTSGMENWEPARSANGLPTSGSGHSPTSSAAAGNTKTYPESPRPTSKPHERREGRSLSDSTVKYAGFWRRFAAYAIDFIGLTIVSTVAILLLAGGSSTPEEIEAMGNCVGFFAMWLYFASMESSTYQATFGKMALGITVTDEHGEPIEFGKATGRHFGKILSGLILGIGFLMAGFTEKKQALHDKMANCLVIKK